MKDTYLFLPPLLISILSSDMVGHTTNNSIMVWTLVVLIILCSSATGSSGWSLPKRINIHKDTHQLQLSLINLLHDIRGGGDDDTIDDDTIDNDNDDAKDAMNEVRKQWSSIQATPSISYPVTKDDMFSDQNTLADLDNIQKPTTEVDGKRTKAIIIMDGFSPYHGEYLSHAGKSENANSSVQCKVICTNVISPLFHIFQPDMSMDLQSYMYYLIL